MSRQKVEHMTTAVTVKVFFEAAHRLHNPSKSDEWNVNVFGKCNNQHGHGHNYMVEVIVEGEVNPETGYLIDMTDLKSILHHRVIAEVDHKHLNIEVPWLENTIPSAENLARIFFERVASELPGGVSLAAITVHETNQNSATYCR